MTPHNAHVTFGSHAVTIPHKYIPRKHTAVIYLSKLMLCSRPITALVTDQSEHSTTVFVRARNTSIYYLSMYGLQPHLTFVFGSVHCLCPCSLPLFHALPPSSLSLLFTPCPLYVCRSQLWGRGWLKPPLYWRTPSPCLLLKLPKFWRKFAYG